MKKIVEILRKNKLITGIIGLIVGGLVVIGFFNLTDNPIKPVLEIEAGVEYITVEQFLKDAKSNVKAEIVSDVTKIQLNHVGEHEIKIRVKGKVFQSKLLIKDTIAPIVRTADLSLPSDGEIKAEQFIAKAEDKTSLKYVVINEKEIDRNKDSEQIVKIRVTDEGNNQVEVSAKLVFLKLIESINLDVSKTRKLKKEDFVSNGKSLEGFEILTDLNKLSLSSAGKKEIEYVYKGKRGIIMVTVEDKEPPKVVFKDAEIWLGEDMRPERFISSISENGDYKVEFSNQLPMQEGTHSVSIRVVDTGGHKVEKVVKAVIRKDYEKPVIHNVRNFDYYPIYGGGFAASVYATDNRDGRVAVSVDTSKVNQSKKGSYPVTYTAKDSAGNVATATANVYVWAYEPQGSSGDEQLDKLADSVLKSIVHSRMSKYEQARAVFNWAGRFRSSYINYGAIGDKRNEAIRGFTRQNGNCYTVAYTQQVMFQRLGIPTNIRLRAPSGKPDDDGHGWTIFNLGNGWRVSDPLWSSFDKTEAQLSKIYEMYGYRAVNMWNSVPNHIRKEIDFVEFGYKKVNDVNVRKGFEVKVEEGSRGYTIYEYDVYMLKGKEISSPVNIKKTIVKPVEGKIVVGTDNIKPIISGVKPIVVTQGDPIDYTSHIVVSDNAYHPRTKAKEPVKLVVIEKFTSEKVGTFVIQYKAIDASGNETIEKTTLTVQEKVVEEQPSVEKGNE